jgi:hypothetical protein
MAEKINEEEAQHQIDLEHLEVHLIDRYDVYVSFSYNEANGCSEEGQIITINTRQTVENQLYTLLHEAGHYILYKDFEYDILFPAIIRQPFKKRFSKASAVSVITNEVMAWETGRQLASLLGIDIDQVKWDKMKNKCLYDYMKWATGVL